MSEVNLADQFVEELSRAGIEHIYGVVEPSLRPIIDAVRSTDGVSWTEVPDDLAGVAAAADEAGATGRVAVCAGSYATGETHLIRGLQDAHRRGVPVLALATRASSAPSPDHPERLFVECCCYCARPEDPAQLPQLARTAIQHALVRADVSVLLLGLHSAVRRVTLSSAPDPTCGLASRSRQPIVRTHGCAVHLTRRQRS